MQTVDKRELTLKEETHKAICEIYNSYRKKIEVRGKYWGSSQEKIEVRALLSTLSPTELAEIQALRNIGRGKEEAYDLYALVDLYLAQDSFSPLQRLSKDRKLDSWVSLGMAKSGATFITENTDHQQGKSTKRDRA